MEALVDVSAMMLDLLQIKLDSGLSLTHTHTHRHTLYAFARKRMYLAPPQAGLSKHIGLSNFNSTQIDEIVAAARIKPAVLQIESHPLFPNTKLIAHAKKHGSVFVLIAPRL